MSLAALDGRLGPVSFTLRRAISVTVLASVAAFQISRSGVGRIAGWAAAIAALAVVTRAPSVPIALIGFVVALAAIQIGAQHGSSEERLAVALPWACLSYVALRLAVDLVPHAAAMAQMVERGAGSYIRRTRGVDDKFSFTVLGGAPVALGVLYLLWPRRGERALARPVLAIVAPLTWFAALGVVMPGASAGPLAALNRGAFHGLFWLAVAVAVDALATRRQNPADAEDQQPPTPTAHRNRLPLTAVCLAAAFAGVCLIGTACTGTARGKAIRVHNYGGRDWDRPEFGRFGGFSGGMFGLLPVYCRAEGYGFDVIEHWREVPSGKTPLSGKESGAASARQEAPPSKLAADPPAPEKPKSKAPAPAENARDKPLERLRTILGAAGAWASKFAPPPKPVLRPTDAIEPADLVGTQILVLINSPKVWDEHGRRTVLDFVARGGSLLVLGDHTDVFGLMRGFNSLLGPFGIKFPI